MAAFVWSISEGLSAGQDTRLLDLWAVIDPYKLLKRPWLEKGIEMGPVRTCVERNVEPSARSNYVRVQSHHDGKGTSYLYTVYTYSLKF